MTRLTGLILPFVSLYGCAAQQVYQREWTISEASVCP
jgi:hypothetical protein